MIFTRKCISRRTFVRGMGTALALPLLDAMIPAAAASQVSQAKTRLGFFFVPNGVTMDRWTPVQEGSGFKMTPILEPLAPFRDRLLVLSGLDHQTGLALDGEDSGEHARSRSKFRPRLNNPKTSLIVGGILL